MPALAATRFNPDNPGEAYSNVFLLYGWGNINIFLWLRLRLPSVLGEAYSNVFLWLTEPMTVFKLLPGAPDQAVGPTQRGSHKMIRIHPPRKAALCIHTDAWRVKPTAMSSYDFLWLGEL